MSVRNIRLPDTTECFAFGSRIPTAIRIPLIYFVNCYILMSVRNTSSSDFSCEHENLMSLYIIISDTTECFAFGSRIPTVIRIPLIYFVNCYILMSVRNTSSSDFSCKHENLMSLYCLYRTKKVL